MNSALDFQTVWQIQALLTEWAYLIDHGQAAAVVELFTADASFDSAGMLSQGRAELAARFERRQARERTSRHVWSNLRLTALGPDLVQGEAILTVFRHDGPGVGPATAALVLDLRDRYTQVAGRWRIAARTLTRIFHDPPPG